MSEPFVAEIKMFGGNFAPRGYAFCDGQLMSIAQNTALFSLVGTTYGGDGRTTFGLPDLRGRFPLHPGAGPGLPTYRWGQKGGTAQQTLTVTQLPAHTHSLKAKNGQPDESNPGGGYPASLTNGTEGYSDSTNTTMNADVLSSVGGNQPIDNMPPYTAIYFIIALVGLFPSRS